jgi:hypothetical protein
MREELDNKLCVDFPQLYRQRHWDASKTCMCWGFECGDGWFDIIYELSQKLDALFKKHNLNGDDYPACVQVKEKFGYLRFYMEGIPKEIYEEAYTYINEAEYKTGKACEECGKPGKIQNFRGWYRCACEEHSKDTQGSES